jgi:1-acyl-sn-glycerol-3-phosphate acyltransferase
MKRPKSSLEDVNTVIEYYRAHDPNYKMMRALHFLSGKLFNVDTRYAQGAQEAIDTHIQNGGQLLIAANHYKFQDPLILASMIEREKIFHPMRGHVAIPGNAPLFNHPVYGPIVSRGGAIPVFRSKDVASLEGIDIDDKEEQRRIANKMSGDIMVDKLNKGMHGAWFPEGTRGKDKEGRDPRVLMPLYKGIGHTACSVERPENLLIVCAGISYGLPESHALKATVAIAPPYEVANTPEEVVARTAIVLQRTLDYAFAEAAS